MKVDDESYFSDGIISFLPMGSVLLYMKDIPTAILYCYANEAACLGYMFFVLNNSCIGKTNFEELNPRLRAMSADSEGRICKG